MSIKTQAILLGGSLMMTMACGKIENPTDRYKKDRAERKSKAQAPTTGDGGLEGADGPAGGGSEQEGGGGEQPVGGSSTALSCNMDINGKNLCVETKEGDPLDICVGESSDKRCDAQAFKNSCEQRTQVKEESGGVAKEFVMTYVYFFNDDIDRVSVCDANPVSLFER